MSNVHPIRSRKLRLRQLGEDMPPPRPWAYGHYLLFGQAGVLGAVDGAGKGAIAIGMALAMITGKPLLGEKVWRTGPVVIVSYEDDEDEWNRRIRAACIHYALDFKDIRNSIYFVEKDTGRVTFGKAATAEPTPLPMLPDSEDLIDLLVEVGAVLLIVDPFNHAHDLEDGNNNVMVARVAAEMTRIAATASTAALVLHHLRKGSSGGVDDLMGATSLRATFRSCRILARMTTQEAEATGAAEPWRHLRITGSKENYAPPPELSTWYRLESVTLDNGAGIYLDGDNMGVATPWTPPRAFDGLSWGMIAAIFERIRTGPGDGEFFTSARTGKGSRWLGALIVELATKTPDQAAGIIARWTENGVLIEGEYRSPSTRKAAKKIELHETKAAEMLSVLRPEKAGDE